MTAKTKKHKAERPTAKEPGRSTRAARSAPDAAAAKAPRARSKRKSGALAAVLSLAADMERVGIIDKKTLRSYEEVCAPPDFSPEDVIRIRRQANASQGYFARSLNVSTSAVQQWESGAKRPSGTAARLLAVVQKHGLEVLA